MTGLHIHRHMAASLIALGLALPTGVVAQTWTGASGNPDDLSYRLDLLDAEIADLRARLGGASVAPATGGGDIEVGRLEAEVGRLTGEIERLQFENRQLREQVRRQLEDLVYRVTELEGGDPSEIGPITLGTPEPDTAPPVVLSEQADLDRAKLDIQQGRYDQGESRLQNFLADYPQSPLVSEAHYWLGQSQFVRGAFPAAASTYLDGYRANQRGGFAAENLLQLGVTLGRLGQVDAGCRTLKEVTRQFPDASTSVREGTVSELATLGCS